MLTMTLAQIAQVCAGEVRGDSVSIHSISTDSRQITPDQLFIALVGEHFDGHNYVQSVYEQGARAVLVEHWVDIDIAQVRVDDTRIALGKIAAWQRQQFIGTVAAITGSNGKTTVKEMLSAILRTQFDVLATQGNFNNDIGLPLTLLRLTPEHQAIVVELGANHPGEIAYTVGIAKPDVALINNIGDAHIEGFGSRDGVAQAKSEIFTQLDERGSAIFEANSPYQDLFVQRAAPAQCMTFALDAPADVYTQARQRLSDGCYQFELWYQQNSVSVRLQVPGEHSVKNSCAAAAVALQMGISLPVIGRVLSEFSGVAGRLRRLPLSEYVTVFDDTYNANPSSFTAALDVLCRFPGEAILVAGDMGELGELAVSAHRQLGEEIHERQLRLMATGPLMQNAVIAAGERGHYFVTQSQLQRNLLDVLQKCQQAGQPCCVVIKGSRSSQMEQTVRFLQQQFNRVN
ncbi:UDP-N-acetylmuramoyl-tripeptide--D-alanyl-D-alanine ligase [Celerinatantimonas sp. YJH-8]|uniref:UDP-N-acetylmuramoyl-tripeptide--D-alanyl-D- alanine ligase n=1 Tax=Celerinatantimonas sp. YJH-8 TaxID=3228714 RepID=UPI0038C31BF2